MSSLETDKIVFVYVAFYMYIVDTLLVK